MWDEAVDRGVSAGLSKLHFQSLDSVREGSVFFLEAAAHVQQGIVTALVRLRVEDILVKISYNRETYQQK